ncbi:MAG: OsmC family protein [Pseudobdellovibrionaceae bacterium]
MLKFPMLFPISSDSASGIQTPWVSGVPGRQVQCAIPPEFSGPGGGFSPEDLYGMALNNCFVATFKVYAERSRLQFLNIKIDSQLSVDRDETGSPIMKHIEMKIVLSGAVAQKDLAERLLQKTSETCMVLNSTKTTKKFSFELI